MCDVIYALVPKRAKLHKQCATERSSVVGHKKGSGIGDKLNIFVVLFILSDKASFRVSQLISVGYCQ